MNTPDESRFVESLKRTSAVAWEGLEYRVELLTLEMREERQRLVFLGVLTQITMFAAFMAFLCLNLLILVVFWDTHRVTATLILSGFYVAVTCAAALCLRWKARTAAHPFAATLEELKKDRAAMTRTDK